MATVRVLGVRLSLQILEKFREQHGWFNFDLFESLLVHLRWSRIR